MSMCLHVYVYMYVHMYIGCVCSRACMNASMRARMFGGLPVPIHIYIRTYTCIHIHPPISWIPSLDFTQSLHPPKFPVRRALLCKESDCRQTRALGSPCRALLACLLGFESTYKVCVAPSGFSLFLAFSGRKEMLLPSPPEDSIRRQRKDTSAVCLTPLSCLLAFLQGVWGPSRSFSALACLHLGTRKPPGSRLSV